MKNKEYSRSTDIKNAAELYDNLPPAEKALIDAMLNMQFATMQSIQLLLGDTNQNERKDKSA